MANTLKIKRGTAATIPQGQLAEPLFTTDTYDLYIGKGSGGNQRFQKYIASGTSSQFLKGDGSLDSTTYQDVTQKGAANGYASLDSGGKVPVSELPNSIMEYKGTWDASTNTPTLANGTGNAGDVYICSVGGTVNFGAGPITFAAGDWVVYSGSIWQKSINSNAVASVNGYTGAVVLYTDDISEDGSPINLWFTNTRARAALSATSPIQYDNSTGVISVLDASASQSGVITTGTQTIAGIKSFTENILGSKLIRFGDATGVDYYVRGNNVATSSTGRRGLFLSDTATIDWKFYAGGNSTIGAWTEGVNTLVIGTGLNGGGGTSEVILFHSTGRGNMLALDAASNRMYAYLATTFSSSVTASSFIRSGGTSSQFLKADGSIDSNTYVTGGPYLPLTGGTLTGNITAPAFIPNGSTVPTNGMYLSAANNVSFATNTTKAITIDSSQRVGIGTDPISIARLYVNGDIQNTNGGLTIAGTISAGSTITGNLNAIIVSDISAAQFIPTGTTRPVVGMYLVSGTSTLNGVLGFSTGTTERLRIDASTGAATFSSSVTATGNSIGTFTATGSAALGAGGNIRLNDTANSSSRDWAIGNGIGSADYGDIALVVGTSQGATPSSTKMIIKSGGNVGIGTSSINAKLEVAGAVMVSGADAGAIASRGVLDFFSGNTRLLSFGANTSTAGGFQFIPLTSNGTGSAAMTITSGGRVEMYSSVLANSPSEGATGEGLIAGRSFKIDATGSGQSAKMYVVSNTLSDTYGSGLQAQYSNFAGDKAFGFNLNTSGGYETYIKNSGGSFVRAMTINQAANVLIGSTGIYGGGTTNESELLVVGNPPTADTDRGLISFMDNRAYNTATLGAKVMMGGAYNTAGAITFFAGLAGLKENTTDGNYAGALAFYTRANGAASSEKVRITSGGLVGINCTPGYQLDVSLPSGSNGQIIRMNRSAGAYGWGIGVDGANSNFNFYNNGGTSVGNINNSTGAYTATSDIRLKENIFDSDYGLDKVLQIKVRKYDWKNTDIKEDYGFIAQELYDILPQYVQKGDDNSNWGVSKAELVPILVKAIQELKAEIDSLKN